MKNFLVSFTFPGGNGHQMFNAKRVTQNTIEELVRAIATKLSHELGKHIEPRSVSIVCICKLDK